ncbi:MAG TPA: head-tail adaptor protein [Candidatus Limnocylindrales bacterium]
MLSAADLASMQATLTASMPDSCTLITDTLAPDGAGGQTRTPVTVATVACRVWGVRLNRATDAEVVVDARVSTASTWVITLPFGTVVDPTYRIGNGGREFEIMQVHAPYSFGLDVRTTCKLVNSGVG